MLQAVRTGAADIGFVAPNPERAGQVLYSQTYMRVLQSALVRRDAPFHSVRELDRPGVVIGVNTDDSVGVWMREHLRAAQVRATPDYSLREAVDWLKDGSILAFAGNRQRLASNTREVSDLRLLPDDFYGVPQAIAVRLQQSDRLKAVDAALDDMRASGLLAVSIARSGVDGIELALPAAPPR